MTDPICEALMRRLSKLSKDIKRMTKKQRRQTVIDSAPYLNPEAVEQFGYMLEEVGEIVGRCAETIAKDTTRQLRTLVEFLVSPEYRAFVLASKELLEGAHHPGLFTKEIYAQNADIMNGVFSFLALLSLHNKKISIRQDLPEEVTPQEVKQWAIRALEREEATRAEGFCRELPVPAKDLDFHPVLPCCTWKTPHGPVMANATTLALLYLAEKAARELAPSPLVLAPVSTEKPVRRAVASLGGAHPEDLEKRSKLLKSKDPIRLEFRWDDGTALELPFEKAGPTAPLLAVAHKYGDVAVKHLLALFAFTWGARASAGQSFWWWPAEHLEVVGLKNNQQNRDNLKRWIEGMTKSRFFVHFPKGKPMRGPMVTVGMDIVAPFSDPEFALFLHLHPALYQGVTDQNGRPGNQWWPTPLELLRMPASPITGKVHVLAPVLGAMFRAGLHEGRGEAPPVARVSVERLESYLAVYREPNRKVDHRAAASLRRTLDAALESGFLSAWHLEGGELARGEGNIIATPGPMAMEILNTGEVPRPAWLPATSSDLKDWIQRQGKTTTQLGKMLGIPGSTLRRVSNYHPILPLPPNVRGALRRYLWRIPAI